MPDRPLECSQCKKEIKVTYKEIVGDTTICTEMCADCPVVQEKLHGEIPQEKREGKNLCCNTCETSLDEIKMGQPLGCSDCYAVFGDFLVGELLNLNAVPPALKKALATKRVQAIHIGKSPDQKLEFTLSERLKSFQDALTEALKVENYEQAAWIRDQIKALGKDSNASQN